MHRITKKINCKSKSIDQRIKKLCATASAHTPAHAKNPSGYPDGSSCVLAAQSYINIIRVSTSARAQESVTSLTYPPSTGPMHRARLTMLCATPFAYPTAWGGVTGEYLNVRANIAWA